MNQLFQTGAALAPVLLVLALLALRVPSLRAGTAGLLGAVLAAVVAFSPTADQVRDAVVGLGPTVVEVALILLGGVTLAVVMARSGARDRIADRLERIESSGDRTFTILLLVFGLTPLIESVTGFGLGVVITAPLLLRLGLSPVKAVVTGLLGLVLVPWGSLAPGTLVAAELGGVDFGELGLWSALLTLPVLLVSTATVLVVLGRRPTWGVIAVAAMIVGVQWGALVAANATVGTPPAGVLSAAAVIALLLALVRLRHGPLPPADRELARALLPYVVLLAGILGATIVARLAGSDRLDWLAGPAVWINIAALVAVASAARTMRPVGPVLREALATWVPVAGTAVVFMLLGIVMATAGMAAHLADLAARAGGIFLALVPAIGALGGYLTGSNTGAAAMFSTATGAAATGLDSDALVPLAGQNVAGSYAIIVSPPRVALAVGVVLAHGHRLPRHATRILTTAVLIVVLALGGLVAALA